MIDVIVSDHVTWVFIVGFAGLGVMLVLISAQIDRCRTIILHSLALYDLASKPPGFKAIEYHPDGTIKRMETVPDKD